MGRLIDADELQRSLHRKEAPTAAKRYTEGFNDCLLRVKSMVHSTRTVDPVHAAGGIYCRECKYWVRYGGGDKRRHCYLASIKSVTTRKEDDFCSRGVKKGVDESG